MTTSDQTQLITTIRQAHEALLAFVREAEPLLRDSDPDAFQAVFTFHLTLYNKNTVLNSLSEEDLFNWLQNLATLTTQIDRACRHLPLNATLPNLDAYQPGLSPQE